MTTAQKLATHLRGLYHGPNKTGVHLSQLLDDLNWEEANTQIGDLNTIVALVFHIDYYVGGVTQVLHGGSLDIRDKWSFDHPPVTSQVEWKAMIKRSYQNAETMAKAVEQLTDEQLDEGFVKIAYGDLYSNVAGLLEHSNYHIGQISIIKKLIRAKS